MLTSWRRPRGDPLRAACLLWVVWLAGDVAAFAATNTINAYYLGALTPPVAALTGIGIVTAGQRARPGRSSGPRLAVIAVAAGTAGYGYWLLAPVPAALRILAIAAVLVHAVQGQAQPFVRNVRRSRCGQKFCTREAGVRTLIQTFPRKRRFAKGCRRHAVRALKF